MYHEVFGKMLDDVRHSFDGSLNLLNVEVVVDFDMPKTCLGRFLSRLPQETYPSGSVTQLGLECHPPKMEARGSNPLGSVTK